MLNALRLRNFRSLRDTGRIDFRPITLLLGQNSSGKSTFLRFLPLIRQSLRTRTNAPILWYGDLVDFGSFNEVKSTFAPENGVGFSFYIDRMRADNPYYRQAPRQSPILSNVSIDVNLTEIDDFTRVREITLSTPSDTAIISLDQKGHPTSILVNGEEYVKVVGRDKIIFSQSDIIPQASPGPDRDKGVYAGYFRPLQIIEHEIFSYFAHRFDRRVSIGTIRALVRRISYAVGDEFIEKLNAINLNLKSWHQVRDQIIYSYRKEAVNKLRALYFVGILPELLHSISNNIGGSLRDLAYVGPSRATGERYYRHQELAIDQIDPQGRNLAMYLASLTVQQRDNFSGWLEKQIGYSLNIGRERGHIQIELREKGASSFHNLADMGYGFSQILPVLAQIWGQEVRGSSRPRGRAMMAIEQPELHLHPAYQARIADIMALSLSSSGGAEASLAPAFIVETHSEALINRLGQLIYEKVIPASAVAIYLFHRLSETDETEISRSTFDDTGVLIDWPLGFFSARSAI